MSRPHMRLKEGRASGGEGERCDDNVTPGGSVVALSRSRSRFLGGELNSPVVEWLNKGLIDSSRLPALRK
eukprot:4755953-Pyramimonas_sp.AAC.1